MLHQAQENGLTEECIVNSEYACCATIAILLMLETGGGWRRKAKHKELPDKEDN